MKLAQNDTKLWKIGSWDTQTWQIASKSLLAGNWLTKTTRMTLNLAWNIKHCTCWSERFCYYGMVLCEYGMSLKHPGYQLGGLGCAKYCPENCSDGLRTTWKEGVTVCIGKCPRMRWTKRYQCRWTGSDYNFPLGGGRR